MLSAPQKKERHKKETIRQKKHFSISFLIGIPANFFIGGFCTFAFVVIFSKNPPQIETWLFFLTGLIFGLSIVGTSAIPKFRTLLHESKHALVVLVTGNKLKDIHVETHTGHVTYDLYQEKVHFLPLIVLAPYFLPLLSLPSLIVALILDPAHHEILSGILGFTLAADLTTSISELHPNQSDLRLVPGGLIISLLYIAGFHLMWCAVCVLWVLGGIGAFAILGNLFLSVLTRVAANCHQGNCLPDQN